MVEVGDCLEEALMSVSLLTRGADRLGRQGFGLDRRTHGRGDVGQEPIELGVRCSRLPFGETRSLDCIELQWNLDILDPCRMKDSAPLPLSCLGPHPIGFDRVSRPQHDDTPGCLEFPLDDSIEVRAGRNVRVPKERPAAL